MPEAAGGREGQTVIVPPHIGAVFELGSNRAITRDRFTGEDTVPAKDFSENGRLSWALLNTRRYVERTFPRPEAWKAVVDDWIGDLRTARDRELDHLEAKYRQVRKDIEEDKELSRVQKDDTAKAIVEQEEKFANKTIEGATKTEEQVKAMMAIAAAARAMERSDGSAGAYVEFVSSGIGRDAQSLIPDYLLHGDPQKYSMVLDIPQVEYFYRRILEDAGIEVKLECGQRIRNKNPMRPGPEIEMSVFKVDKEQALRKGPDTLVAYLKDKARLGGFDKYVDEVLIKKGDKDFFSAQAEKGFDRRALWSAAKIAMYAFLVEKYTRWEFALVDGADPTSEDSLRMQPVAGWGGDPFRATLEPTFLLRRIKKVYAGTEGAEILQMVDNAFRPEDMFRHRSLKMRRGLLKPTAVENLKKFDRWNVALWTFFGSNPREGLSASRGEAIPLWTKQILNPEGGDLDTIIELLDEVYGRTLKDRKNGKDIEVGKGVLGAMICRMIEAKALASVHETARPNASEYLRMIFELDPEKSHPFYYVMASLWGPYFDARSGLFSGWKSPRVGVDFRTPEALKSYHGAYKKLLTNSKKYDKDIWKGKLVSAGGKLTRGLTALSEALPRK